MDIDPIPYRIRSTPFILIKCVCGSRLPAYSMYPFALENFDPNFDPQTLAESLRRNRPLPDPNDTWYVYGQAAFVVNINDLEAFNQAHDDHSHEPVQDLSQQASLKLERLTTKLVYECLGMYRYHELDEEEGEVCAVCLAGFEKDDKVTVLECKHRFHLNCIEEWLLRKNVCPLCKRPALEIPARFLDFFN